ncbi:MAG: HNH endonuclease family protein, partial [bacterium]|nr:HNH endonuclease family protein [bacterium]
ERIVDILDRIKNLQLIFIRCQDKSAAFKLFESINATGVDLTTNDLIKNSIFESMYEDKKSFDFVELGWKEMTEEFNENSTELKTYIRHHWISTVDYTSHSKLFDDFMEEYKDKDDILKYAKSLFNLAPVYNSIRKGEVELLDKLNRNRNDLNEIKEILKFMSSLGVDQIYSVLLNIYNNEPGKFKKDLIRLSAFQFIFKYIPGSPSLPEKKFANFCSGKLDRSSLMNDLVVICRNKEADFVGKLVEKIKYTGGNSIDIQFILEKYLYFLGKPSKFSNPTIEHIIPQDKNDPIFNAFKIDEKKIIRKINCLGNLTILEKSENSSEKMFNQVFSKKYPLYGKNIFSGNKKIIKYKFDENPERAIDKRANEVASLIYKIFFKALETGK